MTYTCPKNLCPLFDSCPSNRSIPAQEQSSPDEETGEPLYFAACQEFGETFCNLRADELTEIESASKVAEQPPESLDGLYHRMAFVDLANDDSKLRMGMGALSEYVKDCISKKELRLFGCPLFMRTIYEIGQTKVASIRLAESDEAEGLWTDFKRKIELALSILGKQGLAGTDAMKSWLQDCGDITGRAGSYNAYRRIRHEALDGLLAQCRDIALLNHGACEEKIQMLYCGIFDEIDSLLVFLPISHTIHAAPTSQIGEPPNLRSKSNVLEKADIDAIGETVRGIVKEESNRTIKAFNKGQGVTNSLIKRTWGEGVQANDKRSPSERRLIDKVVRMYIEKRDIDCNKQISVTWCCRQVIGRGEDGKYDEDEVKKLDNTVRYDMKSYYDMDAVKAQILAERTTV